MKTKTLTKNLRKTMNKWADKTYKDLTGKGKKQKVVKEKMEVVDAYEMFRSVAKDGGYKLAYYEIDGKTHKFIVIYQGIYQPL